MAVVDKIIRPTVQTDAPQSAQAPQPATPRKPRRWRIVAAVVAAVVVVGGIFMALRPTPVEVAAASAGPAIDSVYASGTVEYVRQARVAPVVASPIRRVLVEEGQDVHAGQTLAELVDGPEQATALQLGAEAALARDRASRQQLLFARGFAAQAARDDARRQAQAAEAAANAARARLADYRIMAPFAGRVLRRDAEPGDLAKTGEALFVIADLSALRITADIDERDMGRLSEGLTAYVRADAFPGQQFEARVSEVTPQGDATGRVFRARLALPDDTPLRPGMTVETNIVTAQRDNAILVPSTAVRDGALWVVNGGAAEKRPVRIGAQGADKTEIVSGLRVGEQVVLNPPATFGDRARVSVSNR